MSVSFTSLLRHVGTSKIRRHPPPMRRFLGFGCGKLVPFEFRVVIPGHARRQKERRSRIRRLPAHFHLRLYLLLLLLLLFHFSSCGDSCERESFACRRSDVFSLYVLPIFKQNITRALDRTGRRHECARWKRYAFWGFFGDRAMLRERTDRNCEVGCKHAL